MPTSRIEIDLSAVEHNAGVIRRVIGPGVSLCAVLKQDGYGLGASRLARRLAAGAAQMLAVYSIDEARHLVEAAVPAPILVLMPVRSLDRMDPGYRHALIGKLHLVLHDRDQLAALEETSIRLGVALPVHVQVDTGLARGGALPDEAASLVATIARMPRIRLAGVMTHFASPCTDAGATSEQAAAFEQWIERLGPNLTAAAKLGPLVTGAPTPIPVPVLIHMANSCATFRARRFHGTMVRVGQALFGYTHESGLADSPAPSSPAPGGVGGGGRVLEAGGGSSDFDFAAETLELRPAIRWTSSIVHVKEVPTGFPVGYGHTWRAARPTRIALVPVGYADGYPRSLSSTGTVVLTARHWDRTGSASGGAGSTPVSATASKPVPVIGRVSMDQITIDVTDVPEPWRRLGAEVELVGPSREAPNHFPRLAAAAGTITHELLCRLGPRVERAYRFPGAEAPRRVPTGALHRAPGAPVITSAAAR